MIFRYGGPQAKLVAVALAARLLTRHDISCPMVYSTRSTKSNSMSSTCRRSSTSPGSHCADIIGICLHCCLIWFINCFEPPMSCFDIYIYLKSRLKGSRIVCTRTCVCHNQSVLLNYSAATFKWFLAFWTLQVNSEVRGRVRDRLVVILVLGNTLCIISYPWWALGMDCFVLGRKKDVILCILLFICDTKAAMTSI